MRGSLKVGTREGLKVRITDLARSLFQSFTPSLRRIAGMPDYPAYLEHLRLHHPETPAPGERQFYEEYLEARYGDGPTRCC